MNSLEGHIISVEVSGSMSIVTVKLAEKLHLRAIVIETPESSPYLVNGRRIKMLFKETEVVLGTFEEHRISLQNRISGTVKAIEKGQLLTKVLIDTELGEISSVISTKSTEQLNIKASSRVWAMVKLNEMMLSE